ncbi:hypothetical protein PIB30_038204 [Stylosanthes scabra]|uniref:Zinc finger GRF-type domain-containing protein n=1 Tax=Stylosanthes scabra TaxID=79078 RepID=A0ABU6RE05_9FABA|nr:hypothetical protein [Stylosanthes scabra]
MVMESEGVSSGSRGSAGRLGCRSERSSLATYGVFLPKGVEDRDGVAPKCHYGVYAKARLPHCQFFLWLDKHTEQLGKAGEIKYAGDTDGLDQQLTMVSVEDRVKKLEDRMAAIELKNKPNLGCWQWLIVCLFILGVSVYVVWI